MQVSARIENRASENTVVLSTDGRVRTLGIPPKDQGQGSAVNGGELLALAVATCYCNDLYREAAALGIELRGGRVEARAFFGEAGEAARSISYNAQVESDAPEDLVQRLLAITDRRAEIHSTLRVGIAVTFESPVTGNR